MINTVPFTNQFMGGLSDDHFLARPGEVQDMENIDIRTSPRHIQLDGNFLLQRGDSVGVNGVVKHIVESPSGWIAITSSDISLNGGSKTALFTGKTVFDIGVSIGSATSDYSPTTNPYGVRHFIIDRLKFYVANYDCSILLANVSLSGILNSETTAITITPDQKILFARQNFIYEFDAITYTLTALPVLTLPQGSICKKIYIDNATIYSVSTKGNDTYFHICRSNGTEYVIDYEKIVKGFKCIDAVGNNGSIWWISREFIHVFSGDNQVVKSLLRNEASSLGFGSPTYNFSDSARVSYNKDLLKISDATSYWEFGWDKPGYSDVLTRSAVANITAISENYIAHDGQSLGSFINSKGVGIFKSGFCTTVPFDSGTFGTDKKSLAIRVGYELPKVYTDSSIKCSIDVQIMTDTMRRNNDSVYLTIGTINDETKTSFDILSTQVAKALETAGYSDKWGWVKFKFKLNAGDPYSVYGNAYFRKTPLLYNDFIIKYETTNSDF